MPHYFSYPTSTKFHCQSQSQSKFSYSIRRQRIFTANLNRNQNFFLSFDLIGDTDEITNVRNFKAFFRQETSTDKTDSNE
uniref:Uncharacterized protein n=1 Tax=Onchocerca volvulus TaxID=6282 RepID=A0A8R1XRS0_ONCVO